MRILHLIHVRFWNAAAQYAVHLAAAQKQAGHDVHIITAAGEPPAEKALALGLSVDARNLGVRSVFPTLSLLRREMAAADVVNAHHADMQNLALLAAGGIDSLLVRTRVDVRPVKGSAVTRRFYERRLDGIIVPGRESKERYVHALGSIDEKLHVVYGGVDGNRFRRNENRGTAFREKLGIPPQSTVFAWVGRLAPIKAPEVFFEAAAAMQARNPDAVFLVAGKGIPGFEGHYEAMARSMKIPGLKLLGHVDSIEDVYSAADAGVITSVGSEAHCRVGLEMMSAGLPVIGSDVGVIPEVVVDGETGYIVGSHQAADLAQAMENIALHVERRKELGLAARRRIEGGFTFERWVAATDAAYEKMLSQRTRAWT